MKEKIENEKTCENCRYFLCHYIKDNLFYRSVHCGHCINSELDKKENKTKKRPDTAACEFWESIKIRIEERKESIKYTLRKIKKQLTKIALLLEDDKTVLDKLSSALEDK